MKEREREFLLDGLLGYDKEVKLTMIIFFLLQLDLSQFLCKEVWLLIIKIL